MQDFSKRFLLFIIIIGLLSCRWNAQDPSVASEKEPAGNEIVISWNELAYQIAYEHDQFLSFIGIRALCMTHVAIHDALNAIDSKYEPYAYKVPEPDADPGAAIAQAAYEILINSYPARKDTLQDALEKWLSKVDKGPAKEAGIRLGKRSAQKIISIREGDGHEKNGDYTPMTKPGDYQYTPEYNWVWIPDFSYAQPFTLDSLTQFRSPPPPALSSPEYARSYNEVKAYGAAGSKVRSEDQTNYAHWWAEFAEHGWNRIGRLTASARELPLWETARLFALINMNIYDLYLVSFDSKYHYDTWRPYTAIRSGDQDGNPLTEPEPDWEPEMLTPPWPEYPSAHAAVGAGGAEIVSQVYGTPGVAFTMESTSALPTARIRSYNHLDSAANHCADSRIMNGFHFRFATEEGKKQGRQVARHVFNNFLRPLKKN